MSYKTFDRIKRYIKRHGSYAIAERSGGVVTTLESSGYHRPRPFPCRVDFVRAFNWAREQGHNK